MFGFLGKILGSGAAQPIEAIGNVFDSMFTSDEEKLSKQALLARIAQKPQLLQAEINKIEAAHRSLFVAGWRPFIGWVCGSAFAYTFIFRDFIVWGMTVFVPEIPIPPQPSTEIITTVLMALLGLGGLRTVEKLQGRSK